MAKIKIISDSTSDIPKNLQEEYGISLLPMHILDGEEEYLDGIDISNEEFYKILNEREKLPSTSRPSPMSFYDAYKKAWEEGYTDLIYVSINSKGSSTYQGAVLEKEDFYDENESAKDEINIHLVDSGTYSMAYGYAVVLGAKLIKEGKGLDEVLEAINNWLSSNRILFVPLDLKCVKKSGRVSAAAAFVGDALGLKPVITFEDGESKVISKIRGEKKVASTIMDMVLENRKENSDYIIAYGSNIEAYEQFKNAAEEKLGQKASLSFSIGSIIALNAGPNVVGIIYQTK